MVDNDDKYAENEEDLSQVRSIIKQLNEDKPSQERHREVVVRADGTKVVRVTKKRRVMLTSADKRRRTRKHVILIFAGIFLVTLAVAAFLLFRMATMSSSTFLTEKRMELQQRWGATDIVMDGAGIEGMTLNVATLVADFPAESMIQRVELSGIQADLSLQTFIRGRVHGDTLNIERAMIVLKNGARMDMPCQQGRDLWKFPRMECKDFSVVYADESRAPLGVKNTQAYMYYPNLSRQSCVVMFSGGEVEIKDWKKIRISEGKAHVSQQGVSDFSLTGTTDIVSDEAEQRRTRISLAGQVPQGSSLNGPFALESNNMSLADFTDGRFEEFYTGRTVGVSHGKVNGRFTMELSEIDAPMFSGEVHLRNICLSSFPALMAVTEHIEPSKRRFYNPLSMNRGYVILGHDGNARFIEIPEGGMVERDLATVRGKMVLNSANELSGELSYGIPNILARVEYPDGRPDPIFQTDGEWAVLRTNLKGLGNMPGDDMAEVEARAAIARRERPERIPFDKLDVNQLTDQLLNSEGGSAGSEAPAVSPAPAPVEPQPANTKPDPIFDNPFETSDNPFESSLPF